MKHDYQIILKKGWHGQNYGDPIIPKVLDLYKHDTKSGSYMNLWLQNQVAMWWVRRTGHRAERIPPLKSNHQFNDLTFTWNVSSDIARYDIFRPKFKELKKYHRNTYEFRLSLVIYHAPVSRSIQLKFSIWFATFCNNSRRFTPYSCRALVCNDFEVMSRTVQQRQQHRSNEKMRRWSWKCLNFPDPYHTPKIPKLWNIGNMMGTWCPWWPFRDFNTC